MSTYLQYVIGASVLIVALGTIWNRALRPMFNFFKLMGEMSPLLVSLTETFKDKPDALKVLGEIAAQFKTDSGSSLRDVVNQIEAAVNESRLTNEALKISVESARLLAEQDRAALQALILKADRIGVKVTEEAAATARIEEAGTVITEDVAALKLKADEQNGELNGSHVAQK